MTVYVVAANPRSAANRLGSTMFVCFALWSLSFTVVHNPHVERAQAQFFVNLSGIGGIAFCGFFAWFAVVFTEKRGPVFRAVLPAVSGAIAIVLIIAQWRSGAIVEIAGQSPRAYGWSTFLRRTPWTYLYFAYGYGLGLMSLALELTYARSCRGTTRGLQARAVAGAAVLASLTNGVLLVLSEWGVGLLPHVGDISFLVWAVGLFYAMTRYRVLSLSLSPLVDKIIETMSDPLVIVNKRGIVRSVNTAALNLLGVPRSAIRGRNLGSFFDNTFCATEEFIVFLHGEFVEGIETTCLLPDGTRKAVVLSGGAIYDTDGRAQGKVCLIRDVSKQHRREQEIAAAVGQEQLRIGQDLHDGLGQHLTGVALRCKALEQRAAEHGSVSTTDIETITALVNKASEKVRDLAKGLSPVAMTEDGLLAALQELAAATERVSNIPCRVRCEHRPRIANEMARTNLYRIAQEALNNAVRHAYPSSILLTLGVAAHTVWLTVRDDGAGFPHPPQQTSGMGLRIMEYRARSMGATLRIRSAPDTGTVIRCALTNGQPTVETQ
jgi:PAS domain S-box-containing protein